MGISPRKKGQDERKWPQTVSGVAQAGFREISLTERVVRPWDGLPREVWSHPSCHHRVTPPQTKNVISICFREKGTAGMGERRKNGFASRRGRLRENLGWSKGWERSKGISAA